MLGRPAWAKNILGVIIYLAGVLSAMRVGSRSIRNREPLGAIRELNVSPPPPPPTPPPPPLPPPPPVGICAAWSGNNQIPVRKGCACCKPASRSSPELGLQGRHFINLIEA